MNIEWIKWEDEMPEEAGMYLTYWSDGSVETYWIDEDEIANGRLCYNRHKLLAWSPTKIDKPDWV